MSGYKEIECGALQALLSTENILLVDVRTDDEVAGGMIRGARHIPLHLLPLRAEELEGDTLLVFYCRSGMRSGQASNFMANRGRANICNLRGGIMAWCAASYPLEPKR